MPEGAPTPQPADSEMPAVEEWRPTDRGPVEVTRLEEGAKTVEEVLDTTSLLRAGYSKKQLKKLASCYAMIKYENLKGTMVGALGAILQKRGDMNRAVGCPERLQQWLEKIDDVVEGRGDADRARGRGGGSRR